MAQAAGLWSPPEGELPGRAYYFRNRTGDTVGVVHGPDKLVLELELDVHSAVVALTHDPKLDDMVLLEALKSPAFYVGALGSRGNTAKRRERLAMFDLGEAEIARLHGPIGLDLGGRTPAEIAVSILAEVIAVRHGVALAQKKPGSAHPAAAPSAGLCSTTAPSS
jgi:xanthine dehydrogenase accessory factor